MQSKIKYLLLVLSVNQVVTLNILGIFQYPGRSHFFVFKPYLSELAKRGHTVTVISHFPQKEPLPNYHDIDISLETKVIEDMIPIERSYGSMIALINMMYTSAIENCRTMLANEDVQKLWKQKRKFDVIVTEGFFGDCSLGLAHHLGAPVVSLTSCNLLPWQYNRHGIPFNPSYIPQILVEGGTRPTLQNRIESTFFHVYMHLVHKYYTQRYEQYTLSEYFDDTPDLEDLAMNVKLLLLYTNPLLMGSTLLPADVKEVGGYHVAETKPLPEDLKKFIEEAKHGVIYISFGSMLKPDTLPKEKYDAILAVLAELPQRVIWKSKEKSLPGNPKNVYLSTWLPQNDILAHPNILAYFSHGGMLGTTEAMYHGVPVVAMPVIADQTVNAAAVSESGLGVQIQVRDLNRETLRAAFKTVLEPEFKNNVKRLSLAWHDQPLTPMDSAIFWTEFGATHNFSMKAPQVNVPYYQYYCIDIIAIFVTILGLSVLGMILILGLVTNGNKRKSKKE